MKKIKDIYSIRKEMIESLDLPLLVGTDENNEPVLTDLAVNTSTVIVGESGAGKSLCLLSILTNLVLLNSHKDLNLLILDRKKSLLLSEFSKMPHVIGYHSNVEKYFEILSELAIEMERRKKILIENDCENWKTLRQRMNNSKELADFPWLVVVIDEMTSTMDEVKAISLEKDNESLLEEDFIRNLSLLTIEGRSLGIKAIQVGQRVKDIPKRCFVNSSMKLVFKSSNIDYERSFMNVKDLKLPKYMGECLFQDYANGNTKLIRTLSILGNKEDEISSNLKLIISDLNK